MTKVIAHFYNANRFSSRTHLMELITYVLTVDTFFLQWLDDNSYKNKKPNIQT